MDASNFQKGLRSRAEAAERKVVELEKRASALSLELSAERDTRRDLREAVDVLTYCLDGSQGIDRDELKRLTERLRRRLWALDSNA